MPRSRVGSVQYLGQNHYRVFWTEKGVRKSKRVRGTREEAEAVIAARLLEQGKGGDMRWRDYWIAAVEPTFDTLAEKTVSGYRRVWRVELEPRIGDDMVGDTTWRQVERVLGDIKATSVQRQAKALWKKMCNLAVRDEILSRNPVDHSIRLKPHKKRPKVLLIREEIAPDRKSVV